MDDKTIIRFHLAAGAMILTLLACNMPSNLLPVVSSPENTNFPAPTEANSSTATPEMMPTPAPLDPLVILDTYPSLATVRQQLEGMVFISSTGTTSLTGRRLLEQILVEQGYDPRVSNQVKENLFSVLNQYTPPYPGAKIYLINAATGLFAEAHFLYPWSLQAYTPGEINNLFIQDDSLAYSVNRLHRGDLPPDMPNTETHRYPMSDEVVADAHYKQFNLARRLTQSTTSQEEAVASVVAWMSQNFFHAYAPGYGWEVYLDGREPLTSGGPVAYPLSIERIYEERVSGCHQPVILMEGMLHTLNIPAVRLAMQGHGVLYLPSLDRYIHGDHVITYPDAPPEVLLLTADEIRPVASGTLRYDEAIEKDKYKSPLLTVPIRREGHSLYIFAENIRDPNVMTCVQVKQADWERISGQLSIFNLRYDNKTCILTSDKVPIQTLEELNSP